MDEFIFDLQRFDTVSTVLDKYGTLPLAIGGEPKTITSSTGNSINVTLTTEGDATQNAAISLSAGDEIIIEDTQGRRLNYELSTAGTDGIVITIGSDSTANIGSIDSGDKFLVSDTIANSLNSAATYSMTSKGLLVDYDSTVKGYDGFVHDSSLTNISLASATLSSLTSNFYRVVEVDNNVLTIDDKSDFVYDTTYAGVYAIDTDTDTTPSIYARLVSTNAVPYRISSVASDDSTLSTINISSDDVLTKGISFTKNFAGDNGSTPTIIAGTTTLHVDSASSSYFTLSGGNNSSPVSLSSNGSVDVSLIGGAITANENQTIKSGTYTISGYADSKNTNDGITISSDGTLSDIDIGESFVLNGSTYRKTDIGYLKDSDTVPLAIGNALLSGSNIDASKLSSAATYSNFHDYKEIITLGNDNQNLPAIIAYGETALATLQTVTSNKTTRYSLSYSGSNADNLHLGEWGGVKLNGKSIWLNGLVANNTAPLKIITNNATVGVMESKGNNPYLEDTLLSGDSSFFSNIKKISLVGGTLSVGNAENFAHTVGSFILGSANNVSINKGSLPIKISADDSGATLNQASAGNITIGRGRFKASLNATIDTDGNTRIPSNKKVTLYDANGSNSSVCSGSVSFIYGKTSGISVTGFTSGTNTQFTVGNNNYTLTANQVLIKTTSSSNNISIWSGSNYSNGVYDLADKNFHNYLWSDGSITISSGDETMSTDEERLYISSDSTVLTNTVYGGLTRLSSGGYILNRASADEPNAANASLQSVFIDNTNTVLPVNFTGNFVNTTVSVGNSSDTVAFVALNDSDYSDFTVSHNDTISVTEINGAKQISLISGSILTNDSEQTVMAGDYSIRSATESAENNGNPGVIIAQSIGSSDTLQIIGDIDYGESFYINNIKYSRDILGLTATDTTGTSFYNVSLVGDNTDISDTGKAVAALIGDLIKPTSKRTMVTSSLHSDSINYIFGINTSSDTISSLVVNDSDPPTIKYGDLLYISKGQYSLGVNPENSTAWNHLNIISISSGNTTIDSFFTSNGTNPVTIMTAGGTSFLVNSTSDDGSFTVSGTATSPAIGGATELTLLNGTINAVPTVTSGDTVANQVINLGTSTVPAVLQVATNTKVGYSDSIGTIAGSYSTTEGIGTGFTLNSSDTYSVIGGTGMNFLVGDSDVTITNLEKAATANADAFYYDNQTYSIRAAGFVRGDKNNNGNALWNKDNNHSLTGATVAVSDINADNDENWTNIAEIDRTTRVASLPTALSGSVIYVDLDYQYTYGKLTGSDGVYSLTKDNATATISSVYIPSNSNVTSLSLESGFKNITVDSKFATVAVPTLSSDYQVYLDSSAKSMSLAGGVENATLNRGSLTSDNNLKVYFNDSSSYIQASDSAIVTVLAGSANSSIALDVGESFKLGSSNTYSLGSLGLTKNTSILPSKTTTGQNTLAISTINSDDSWYNMLAVGNNTLTISSASTYNTGKALVVDSSPVPTAQYASISTASNGVFLKTLPSADTWTSTDTILINTNENVTIANASTFRNRTIVGKNSNAVFSVTSSSGNFVITDSNDGASIANATGINQTGGTILTANSNQKISTADNYTIVASGSDTIKVVAGTDGSSLGALDKNDSFSVKSAQSSAQYSLSSDYRIRTADNKKMWTQTVSGGVVKVPKW